MSDITTSSTLNKKSAPSQKSERVSQNAQLTPYVKIAVSDAPLVLPDDAVHRSTKGINEGQKTGISTVMSSEALIRSMRFSVAKKEKKYVVTLSLPLEQDQPTGKPPHLRYELGSFRSEKKANRYLQRVQYAIIAKTNQADAKKTTKGTVSRLGIGATGFAIGVVVALSGVVAAMGTLSSLYNTYMLNDMYYDYSDSRAPTIAPPTASIEPMEPELVYLPQVDQSRLVQLSDLNRQNIKLVASVAGIELEKKTPDATPFYVFSRLECDDCDTVNRILADVSPEFQPIVLPASFSNDLKSAQSIASAYCSDNPGQAWVQIAQGKEVNSDLKCNWIEKSDVSSKLADLIAVAEHPEDWPLIVAPNGKVSKGSFPRDAAAATRMLNEHLELNRE